VTFSARRELTGAKKITTPPAKTAAPDPTQTHFRDMFFIFFETESSGGGYPRPSEVVSFVKNSSSSSTFPVPSTTALSGSSAT
jgi:hypothetical protein